MKILAKVTPRRMRQLHRIYYDTLDSIQEQMENWLDKVETKYDCEIHVDQSYNDFNGNDDLILDFYVGDMYGVTTPNGYIVDLRPGYPDRDYNSQWMHLYASQPIHIDSEYGDVVFESGFDLGSFSGPGHNIGSDLHICQSRFKNAPSVEESGADISAVKSEILSNISKLPEVFDDVINYKYRGAVSRKKMEAEEAAKREERKHDKLFNTPITTQNISKVFTKLRKESDSKIATKGNVLRVTSYEDDFVEYFDIDDMVSELSSDGVSLGELLDEPSMILDYGSIGSAGIHHAGDESDYKDFKTSMNREYGFSR